MKTTTCYPVQMLPIPPKTFHFDREKTVYRLLMVKGFSGDSIRHYIAEGGHTDAEVYRDCVVMLQDQINDNPEAMVKLLGTSYEYFKYLKFI